ncbi:hypothetical protein [Xanthomonas oryzae]|uniref:hypothetical protein n=1 Tax=Xanthomonas oryzae TaxID=347 RepID=UPI003CCFE200
MPIPTTGRARLAVNAVVLLAAFTPVIFRCWISAITLKTTIAKTLANVPLKRKFFVQTRLVALCIIALAVIAARLQYVDLTDTRRDGLKSQIEMATAVVNGYAERAEKARSTWRRPRRVRCTRCPPCTHAAVWTTSTHR